MTNAKGKTKPDKFIPAWDDMVRRALVGLNADSAKSYRSTYKQWDEYCAAHNIDPVEGINEESIVEFLESQENTLNTRRAKLSKMKKLALSRWSIASAVMQGIGDFIAAAAYKAVFDTISEMAVPTENISESDREHIVFTWDDIKGLLGTWGDERKASHSRNRALVGVLTFTGMRIDEARQLRWKDIDFNHGTIYIRKPKGVVRRKNSRNVAIVKDSSDTGVSRLQAWRKRQSEWVDAVREVYPDDVPEGDLTYVFTSTRRSTTLRDDKPMSIRGIHKVIDETFEQAGRETGRSHWFRHTLLTKLLASGIPIQDVRDHAGHVNDAQTVAYAKSADALVHREEWNFDSIAA